MLIDIKGAVIIYRRQGGQCKSENRMHSKCAPLGTCELRFRPPRILRTEILPPHHQYIDMYFKLSYVSFFT